MVPLSLWVQGCRSSRAEAKGPTETWAPYSQFSRVSFFFSAFLELGTEGFDFLVIFFLALDTRNGTVPLPPTGTSLSLGIKLLLPATCSPNADGPWMMKPLRPCVIRFFPLEVELVG